MEVPRDIAFEIFSWLPAKSVCKLNSTCNSVTGFSEETVFKRKQSRNLLGRDDTCLFIQPERIIQKYVKRVELHPLPEDRQSSGVPEKVLRLLSNSTSVLASGNGLLLCQTINDHGPIEFFIFNPITKCRSFIPTPESLQRNHDFANINIMLDFSSDDYKVFLFENPMEWSSINCYTCRVYHEKEGVWKTMDNGFLAGGRNMNFDMNVFHNKAINVISDCSHYFAKPSPFYKPYIMSYHLENGNSTMLRLPREAIRGCHTMTNMGIFNWGKVSSSKRSICLVKVRKSVFTVWYLKDYESSSWQKVLKVRVRGLGLQEKNPQVTGFTVTNGDILVFATEEKVYSCGLNEERFMMVEEIGQHNCRFNLRLISYSDTFRSCGINAVTWN
ncbi:putative F-box domain-containing protein [Medicago truncatula]|uniref:F-box protein interaction domain protein n=1 Tax=Medicago truncatula TaxID=3880 RepID=G7IB83_MEDTR|nr:F-box protein interaction domain protein [Medicago truncatula]RHN77144.1 putative F-box domain-containing protein [Medicago truncatula]